ncbi:MAG TPA: NCS2 family permease [Acidobacteriota bacterium]|nr:NCS2 family permease [Acidobacteriota bacterium]
MHWREVFADRSFNLRTEFIAGLTSFLTSAYIIAVHPMILSQTGMDQKALIVVTCIASGIATLLMAIWPKVPVLMAPGMGLNAFFAYTVVLSLKYTWQQALGFVFWAGFLFLVLTVIGLRQRIAAAIPVNLRIAGSVGIGLFIAFIGFRNLGLIQTDAQGLMHLSKISATQAIGLAGLALMALLEARRIQGALLLGIIVVTIVAMIGGYTAAPQTWLSKPPDVSVLSGKLQLVPPISITTIFVILTFLYVALFDGLGTLLAVSESAEITKEPSYEKKLSKMLSADSASNMIGAVLGTSTVTAYIESTTGITEGGRTGVTSLFSALFFFLALFFVPLILLVPPYATAPALIMVGVFMIREISRIRFEQWDESLPAFLTIILMPLTTSIATGLMFGFISYTFLKLVLGKWTDLNPILIGITIFSIFNLFIGGRLT